MSKEKQISEDFEDRLVDGALREVVGQETPPDLSEKILFAATGEHSQQLATLAPGAKEMATLHRQETKNRTLWIGAAVAGSLLLAAGLALPLFQASRQAASTREPQTLKDNETAATPGSEQSIIPPSSTPNNSGKEWNSTMGRAKKKDLATNQPASEPDIHMMVTPRIIIQEGEEQRLGILDRLSRASGDRPALAAEDVAAKDVTQSNSDRWHETNESKTELYDQLAVKVQPIADLVLPVEGVATQPRHDPLPAFSADIGVPTQHPSSAHPVPDADRYSFSMGFGRGESLTSGDGQERLGWRSKDNSDLDPKSTNASELLPPAEVALLAKRAEVTRQLNEKSKRYMALSNQLSGAESSQASPELNAKINEIRQVQGKLIHEREKLVELTVQAKLAKQSVSSSSALEQAVVSEIEQDPMIANYESEKYALSQHIRQLKAASKQGTSEQIKRLIKASRQLERDSQAYRNQAEKKIRLALKKYPNGFLRTELTESILKRNLAQERITSLEKALESKMALLRHDSGHASDELALLQSEIEQLQAIQANLGRGPDASGDKYARIYENPFVKAEGEKAVSTFSIDVDTASYANVRQFLTQSGQLPPPDAVRIEELINYFDYAYTPPTDDTPFAAHVEVAGCPWQAEHRLVRVGIKGREIETHNRPQSNLVFLIDVSGSMNNAAKLPLLVEGMKLLTRELGENDRVAIVVYASSEGLALPSTRGDQQDTILAALEKLRAGGSTAGGAGIELAYKIAQENFIQGGVNRVILATDGDFNVGTTSTAELERLAETNAKETGVFLTVLGFGRGNLNDAMMEAISGKGNGNYHYVDNKTEAEKVLVAEMAGTLVTIAKDVKIQIEFNPSQVAGYRLIGYENRMLATEDFNDDKKDAGEIGAGHTVTAIYEIVPAGKAVGVPAVDPLKYQPVAQAAKPSSDADASGELLTLKIRYKQPDSDTSTKLEFPIIDNGQSFAEATGDFKFAAAVASFGMQLRRSEHQGITSFSAVSEIAQDALGKDLHGYRAEFLELVRCAKQLAGE